LIYAETSGTRLNLLESGSRSDSRHRRKISLSAASSIAFIREHFIREQEHRQSRRASGPAVLFLFCHFLLAVEAGVSVE
jgi:hypothetical protein